MSSVSSLRSSLFLQAAFTALYGLMRSDGGSWTILTMVVAAGAVFIGAALVPTPQMRVGALVFEGVAVAFGGIGLLFGHLVPATLIAIVVLVVLASTGAVREFTGTPAPTLSGYGAPVASPFEYPAASELVGAGSVPEVFQFSAPVAVPAPAAVAPPPPVAAFLPAAPPVPVPVAAPAPVAPQVPVPALPALGGAAAVFAAGQSAPGGVLSPTVAPAPVAAPKEVVAVPTVPVVPPRAAPTMTILPGRRKS